MTAGLTTFCKIMDFFWGSEKTLSQNLTLTDKTYIKTKKEPVDSLITDTAIEIFSYLNGADLAACCMVSKAWKGFVKVDKDNGNMLWKTIISHNEKLTKHNPLAIDWKINEFSSIDLFTTQY